MDNMGSKFIVDIEMSLTQEEFFNLEKLSKLESKTIPEVARMCMNTKCEEMLKEHNA